MQGRFDQAVASCLDSPFERIVALLRDSKPTSKGVRAKCPAHDDATPSLDVDRADDGRVLLKCRSANCSTEAIVSALGIEVRDLFPPGSTKTRKNPSPPNRKNPLKRHPSLDEAVKAAYWSATNGNPGGSLKQHVYHDAAGEVVGAVVRVDFSDGRKKQIRRVSRDGDAWLCKDMPAPKPLYRLPRVVGATADPILFAEGEKCVDRLEDLGFVATTSAGGAHAPLGDTGWAPMRGKTAYILPDNDEPGMTYCAGVAAQLRLAGAVSVYVVALDGLQRGQDVFDWITARHDAGKALDDIAAELNGLLASAPEAPIPDDVAGADGPPDDAADDGLVPLGDTDPESGRLVLSPKKTLPTARAFLRDFYMSDDTRTLHDYTDTLWSWQGNRYVSVEEAGMQMHLHEWLHDALRYVRDRETKTITLVDFESNPGTVKAALATIRAGSFLPATTPAPSWIGREPAPYPVHDLLPCRSMTLHLPSGNALPPSPKLFHFNAIDFDYDALAPEPVRWCEFLRELFGDDQDSIRLLRDWFGYCLTADTSQQKILLMIGPRRSGKGTIARVLTNLVGAGNVVGPTVSSLAGQFGLQPLLGKSLAIVSDARFTGESVMTVVERLLCISGEDAVSIDRKFKESVTLKLPVKFAFLTNELPRFNDASTALAGRFLVLRLTKSFYGNEDIHLIEALRAELPSILLWAIEGWHALRDRGRFLEPEASRAAIQDIEDLSSPVNAFVRERCMVGPGHRVGCNDLYQAWCTWCTTEGRTTHTTAQVFGRDLGAAVAGVTRRRCTGRPSFYEGIGLNHGETP